jgi:lipoprotein-releasing system ATP-binding protein
MPSGTSEPVLEARGIVKAYPAAGGTIEVLRGLDLDVAPGEAVAVVGDSGVGKSTLLHVLGGLDRPQSGTLRFRGREVFSGDVRALSTYRNRHVGFVFQFHHLLPELTALENVLMPFRIGRRPGGADEARALLSRLGLAARVDHVPGALSGGEQQRVAIARAVAPGPAVVLADEPTGNLDPRTGSATFALLRELQQDHDFALVVATHSGRLASSCDRLLRLEDGRLRPLDAGEAASYFEGGGADGEGPGRLIR